MEQHTVSERQNQAERSHVLKDLLLELGGLAHEHMTTEELDKVLDNMLTKSTASNPSVDMQRWIHTHRNNPDFKIYQILGAHVAKTTSLVPECFGKFHDAKAAECRVCQDRVICAKRTGSNKGSDGETAGLVQVKLAYQLKNPTTDALSEMLSRKNGQIAQALHHGSKVIITVRDNKLRVLSMSAATQLEKDKDTMAKTKAVAEPEEIEELDEELDGEDLEAEEGEEGEEGEEEEVEEEAEEVEAEPVAAAVVKEKKPKKEKAPLNAKQKEFKDKLDAQPDTAAKQKFSQSIINSLKIPHNNNADARVAHMQRVMAINKHLASAPAATVTTTKKVVKK